MIVKSIFINFFQENIGIFQLMLSTFLIGYFSSLLMERNKNKATIKKLKKKVNHFKQVSSKQIKIKKVNDIETIFTEIKPKIIQVVEETQKNLIDSKSKNKTVENTRKSYLTYTKSKTDLNFRSFDESSKNQSDNLTKLEGIGPYIEQRLNEIGIYKYEQISRLTPDDIRKITELIDFFPGRIERDDWVGQAHSLLVH